MHLMIFSHHWESFYLHKGVNDTVKWLVLLTISINLMYSTFLPVPHTETVISFDGVCYLFYSFTLTGNLVNQLNRFLLSFWNLKKNFMIFGAINHEREREREGGEREGEKFTWICKASTPHGNHPSKMHRRKNQRGYLAVKMSLQCGESTTTLNFLFPFYPFYILANLAWKYKLLPECLNIQHQLLHNLLLQKKLHKHSTMHSWVKGVQYNKYKATSFSLKKWKTKTTLLM